MRQLFTILAVLLLAGTVAWAGEMTPPTKDQPGTMPGAGPGMTPGAGPQAPAQPETPATSEAKKEVEGKVAKMDPSGKSVTLEDGTKLSIPSSLKVARGSLKKGAMVKATYEEKGGQKVATSIQVRPGEKKSY